MATVSGMRRIAWSIFWKTIVAGVILGAIAGAVASFFVAPLLVAAGYQGDELAKIVIYPMYALSVLIYFFVFNYVLASSIGQNIAGKTLEVITSVTGQEN